MEFPYSYNLCMHVILQLSRVHFCLTCGEMPSTITDTHFYILFSVLLYDRLWCTQIFLITLHVFPTTYSSQLFPDHPYSTAMPMPHTGGFITAASALSQDSDFYFSQCVGTAGKKAPHQIRASCTDCGFLVPFPALVQQCRAVGMRPAVVGGGSLGKRSNKGGDEPWQSLLRRSIKPLWSLPIEFVCLSTLDTITYHSLIIYSFLLWKWLWTVSCTSCNDVYAIYFFIFFLFSLSFLLFFFFPFFFSLFFLGRTFGILEFPG